MEPPGPPPAPLRCGTPRTPPSPTGDPQDPLQTPTGPPGPPQTHRYGPHGAGVGGAGEAQVALGDVLAGAQDLQLPPVGGVGAGGVGGVDGEHQRFGAQLFGVAVLESGRPPLLLELLLGVLVVHGRALAGALRGALVVSGGGMGAALGSPPPLRPPGRRKAPMGPHSRPTERSDPKARPNIGQTAKRPQSHPKLIPIPN